MNNRVGLGTFPLADVFNKISKEDAIKLVREFIDQGGYYIDTAPMYGFGEVEKLLGSGLKKFGRDKFFMISKCGYIDVEGKNFQTIQKSGKYNDVIRECDRSLIRMGLDYIDLYFMHSPDPATPATETIGAMAELKKQGKIKTIGVSNVDLKELKEYNTNGYVEFIQNRFSLLNRSINSELEKYLLVNKIGLVPYQVIDRGQLTGSLIEGFSLRKEDLRNGRSDWEPEKLNLIADWSKANLQPISKKLGITLGQLAIAWALHQPYLAFVIVGVTKLNYLPINLKANDIKLSEETLMEIDAAYQKLELEVKDKFKQSLREFRGLNEKYY
jgi:aryl-alcohol dehydrogenase-like predicted oxidoreductase